MSMFSVERLLSIVTMVLLFPSICVIADTVAVDGDGELRLRQTMESVNMMGLSDLPYAHDALEPHLDEQTLRIHHGKHHAKYAANVLDMVKGTAVESESSMTAVVKHAAAENLPGLFNNAAQCFNHAFYWNCMKPNGGGVPDDIRLLTAIEKSFGSFESFRKSFANAGATLFGSGWVWLVSRTDGTLEIIKTSNADTPIAHSDSLTPLLVMDVWEHAYYLHYQNVRPNYIAAFLDHLVNWEFVGSQLPA